MLVLSLVHRVVRGVVAWLDRRTEAPIMQRRINARSEEYFQWRDTHRGETGLDDILDPTSTRKSK